MKENRSAERQSNFDLLRIISTIAVILIHVNWIFLKNKYNQQTIDFEWICLTLINIVTRFSVPSFVMISGSFILNNDSNCDSIKFYRHVIKKIYIPTTIVILILVSIQVFTNIMFDFAITFGLKGVLTGTFYNLWYIYMIFGLYLLTPFIIKLKKNIKYGEYKIISFVFIIWAIISQATSEEKLSYSIGVVFAFLGYYLLGDILRTEMCRHLKLNRCILVLVSLMCIIITLYIRYKGFHYYIEQAYVAFFSPTIVIYSICVFCFFGQTKVNLNLCKLSSITFEIYLFHTLALKAIFPLLKNISSNCFVVIFVSTIGCLSVSIVFGLIFKKALARLWFLDDVVDKIIKKLLDIAIKLN